jgi:hypothetical protein
MQVSDVLASDRKYRAVQPHQRFIVNAPGRLEWRLEWRLGLARPVTPSWKRPRDTRASRITRRVAARAQCWQLLTPGSA